MVAHPVARSLKGCNSTWGDDAQATLHAVSRRRRQLAGTRAVYIATRRRDVPIFSRTAASCRRLPAVERPHRCRHMHAFKDATEATNHATGCLLRLRRNVRPSTRGRQTVGVVRADPAVDGAQMNPLPPTNGRGGKRPTFVETPPTTTVGRRT
jgi:hypothetical protein